MIQHGIRTELLSLKPEILMPSDIPFNTSPPLFTKYCYNRWFTLVLDLKKKPKTFRASLQCLEHLELTRFDFYGSQRLSDAEKSQQQGKFSLLQTKQKGWNTILR